MCWKLNLQQNIPNFKICKYSWSFSPCAEQGHEGKYIHIKYTWMPAGSKYIRFLSFSNFRDFWMHNFSFIVVFRKPKGAFWVFSLLHQASGWIFDWLLSQLLTEIVQFIKCLISSSVIVISSVFLQCSFQLSQLNKKLRILAFLAAQLQRHFFT